MPRYDHNRLNHNKIMVPNKGQILVTIYHEPRVLHFLGMEVTSAFPYLIMPYIFFYTYPCYISRIAHGSYPVLYMMITRYRMHDISNSMHLRKENNQTLWRTPICFKK